jgi:hypothetical protein
MGLWGLYLTLKDYYNNSLLKGSQGHPTQKRLRVKKKNSTLSKRSCSEETVTARYDSSYASLHTTTPEEADLSKDIKSVIYPESPSPWDTYSGCGTESGISLQNNDDLEDESSNLIDSIETTTDSINLLNKPEYESKKDMKKDVNGGTSYSFFPSNTCTVGTTNAIKTSSEANIGTGSSGNTVNGETRASSYSMSFSAVSLNEEDMSETVKSWRDSLEGGWND